METFASFRWTHFVFGHKKVNSDEKNTTDFDYSLKYIQLYLRETKTHNAKKILQIQFKDQKTTKERF